jgi:hypothetical protein
MPRKVQIEDPHLLGIIVNESVYAALKKIADSRNVSVSEVAREIINEYLKTHDTIKDNPKVGGEDPEDDPIVLGTNYKVSIDDLIKIINKNSYNEIIRREAIALINKIVSLRREISLNTTSNKILYTEFRKILKMYNDILKEFRIKKLTRPIGEELSMIADELGIDIYSVNKKKK